MAKAPTVSIKELLHEIEHGKWEGLKPETREKITRMINAMVLHISTQKALTPKKIRNPKAPALLTLGQWEAQVGGQLSQGMLASWINAKRLDHREVAQLIEEFRTEMISKNKLYADFKAAFQTYLTKGYLSKTLAQVAWKAPEGANKTFTRGVSI